MAPVALHHFPRMQQDMKIPLLENENAFLGDIMSSDQNDDKAPISCGLYRLEKGFKFASSFSLANATMSLGTPLVYKYTYHEMKIILEGSFDISDEAGNKVHATPGDVFYFPNGSTITFTTEDYGLAFYTGSRKRDSG